MYLLSLVTVLFTSLGAVAMPPAIDRRQTATRANGTCDVETNTCTIFEPTTLAGLRLNCLYGGGLHGAVNPPCASDGHTCWHYVGFYSGVHCY
ncbi:hypothetical protein B0T16DRAFT_451354 [Cercophora newfieldiana]|uniref:Uncharacterized protein n=1 Tax=Cercophora newfieldiana TaxID=92897 RepID=A0AA40D0D7_9PEZI|nr:hypothetical protein B0T16DRAFT_451354 [Cercophora newfieldiana]